MSLQPRWRKVPYSLRALWEYNLIFNSVIYVASCNADLIKQLWKYHAYQAMLIKNFKITYNEITINSQL